MQKSTAYKNVLLYSRVGAALRCEQAVGMIREAFANHYRNMGLPSSDITELLEAALDKLVASQARGISISELKGAVENISQNVYKESRNPRFFTLYSKYKTLDKPEYYASAIEPDIIGEKILDFGCGKGYLSKEFSKLGYDASGADVLDYSEVSKSEIPFIKLSSIHDISKMDFNSDTITVVTVLHHIEDDLLLPILTQLARRCRRIVIIEDVLDPEFFGSSAKNSALTTKFISLTAHERLHAYNLADFYGNVITQGLGEMSFPFEFKTTSKWERLLSDAGFSNVTSSEIGFPEVSFHGVYQAKIIGDGKKHNQNSALLNFTFNSTAINRYNFMINMLIVRIANIIRYFYTTKMHC